MINLLPEPVNMLGHVKPNGMQYIATVSLDLLLTQMQFNNAKHPEGKPEYQELLQFVRDTLNSIPWSKPE